MSVASGSPRLRSPRSQTDTPQPSWSTLRPQDQRSKCPATVAPHTISNGISIPHSPPEPINLCGCSCGSSVRSHYGHEGSGLRPQVVTEDPKWAERMAPSNWRSPTNYQQVSHQPTLRTESQKPLSSAHSLEEEDEAPVDLMHSALLDMLRTTPGERAFLCEMLKHSLRDRQKEEECT